MELLHPDSPVAIILASPAKKNQSFVTLIAASPIGTPKSTKKTKSTNRFDVLSPVIKSNLAQDLFPNNGEFEVLHQDETELQTARPNVHYKAAPISSLLINPDCPVSYHVDDMFEDIHLTADHTEHDISLDRLEKTQMLSHAQSQANGWTVASVLDHLVYYITLPIDVFKTKVIPKLHPPKKKTQAQKIKEVLEETLSTKLFENNSYLEARLRTILDDYCIAQKNTSMVEEKPIVNPINDTQKQIQEIQNQISQVLQQLDKLKSDNQAIFTKLDQPTLSTAQPTVLPEEVEQQLAKQYEKLVGLSNQLAEVDQHIASSDSKSGKRDQLIYSKVETILQTEAEVKSIVDNLQTKLQTSEDSSSVENTQTKAQLDELTNQLEALLHEVESMKGSIHTIQEKVGLIYEHTITEKEDGEEFTTEENSGNIKQLLQSICDKITSMDTNHDLDQYVEILDGKIQTKDAELKDTLTNLETKIEKLYISIQQQQRVLQETKRVSIKDRVDIPTNDTEQIIILKQENANLFKKIDGLKKELRSLNGTVSNVKSDTEGLNRNLTTQQASILNMETKLKRITPFTDKISDSKIVKVNVVKQSGEKS